MIWLPTSSRVATRTVMPTSNGIVVTGSSSGIGRGIAIRLATASRDDPATEVLVHYCRNRDGAEQTAEVIRGHGVACQCIQADLSDHDDIERFANEAFERLGRIQTWVNNAGMDVLTGEAKDWSFDRKLRSLLEVDLCGTAALSRIVGDRLMRQSQASNEQPKPSVIFIGWDQAAAGMEGDAGMMFGPVKAAVMAFANSFAQSMAPHVRVNTVAPGWIQTAWGDATHGYWDRRAKAQSLMERWGRPEDVAEAVAFLTSSAASFMTGQTIPVNGGFSRRFDK